MTYYIQNSTIDWPKDQVLFEDTMNTLEKLCDIQSGYILNEPVSKFGWTFIDMILKGDLHMSMEQEFSEQINKSKGSKPEEKFINFLVKYLENNNCKIKLKLMQSNSTRLPRFPPFFLVVSCGIGVTSSIFPILNPPLASARIAACAPGPGTLEPTPPTARTLICNPVNPFVFADSDTTFAAFIAAKGDDSYLSALT